MDMIQTKWIIGCVGHDFLQCDEIRSSRMKYIYTWARTFRDDKDKKNLLAIQEFVCFSRVK